MPQGQRPEPTEHLQDLPAALRALYEAIWNPPAALHAQQDHQAVVIPALRDRLHFILTYEFSRAELALLREELEDYEDLEHDDTEDLL